MIIDNYEQIRELLSFESDDEFYYVQILKRKKEHIELGSNSQVVKTYYITSAVHLDKHFGEMKCLAEYHNARVYINLNKRSFEKTCFHTLKKLTDQIMNKEFKHAKNAFSSVCGTYSTGDKLWIVDIDKKGREANDVLKFIDTIQPVGSKLIAIIDTKNGVHLITKPFNLEHFRNYYLTIDVHKNNPTILYIP